MNKLILASFSILLLASCTSTQKSGSSISQKEKDEGWQLLFDGKTTNGWHLYGEKSAGNFWKANNGLLFPDTENQKNFGNDQKKDLVTDEDFGDFHLKLEWRISEKGNSGILFFIKEDPKYDNTYVTGPEMQVLDNGTPIRKGHEDGKLYTHRAGDLYDLLASKEANKPQGEWNQVEIKSYKGKLDFYMNGEHTLSTTMWNQYWQEMIAISKFKYMPDFGKFTSGKIGLQFHGDGVWFRNIKIKKL